MARHLLVEGVVATDTEPDMVVYLRLERNAEGRAEVREAAMTTSATINAASWREVPFEMTASLATLPAGPGLVLGELMDASGPLTLAELLDSELDDDEAAEQTLVFGAPTAPRGPSLLALKAPSGALTDAFMADLAAAHRELVASGQPPAPAIAEQTNTPVRTVHRWISQARKRDFLPPATRGRTT
jgi:hypothetical protein